MASEDRQQPGLLPRLRSVRPASVAVVVAVILAGGIWVFGGDSPPEPLPERIADCLDDYFESVSLDPISQGLVGSQAEAGGVNAVDGQGDEADVGIEDDANSAQRLAILLRPLKVERVGPVVFSYRGDSGEERRVVARCATGLYGTKSPIERR